MEKTIMRKSFAQITYLLLLTFFVSFPCSVFASAVYIDTNHSDFFVGDSIMFTVRVDSEGKNINAIEGGILLDHAANAASLTDINTAGSAFSLWPTKPLPSERNTHISFAGGSPGGLLSKDAVVFHLILKLKEPGKIALSPDNIGVYVNDGKGTKDDVDAKELIINVLPRVPDAQPVNDWDAIILDDKTPPEPFEITLGQDPSLFENQYFISFFTTDTKSGVAYYEVQEGNEDFTRTDSPHLLKDQTLQSLIKIKAVDKAGNEKIAELMPSAPVVPSDKNNLAWITVSILIVVISYVFWRNMRRKKKI